MSFEVIEMEEDRGRMWAKTDAEAWMPKMSLVFQKLSLWLSGPAFHTPLESLYETPSAPAAAETTLSPAAPVCRRNAINTPTLCGVLRSHTSSTGHHTASILPVTLWSLLLRCSSLESCFGLKCLCKCISESEELCYYESDWFLWDTWWTPQPNQPLPRVS